MLAPHVKERKKGEIIISRKDIDVYTIQQSIKHAIAVCLKNNVYILIQKHFIAKKW